MQSPATRPGIDPGSQPSSHPESTRTVTPPAALLGARDSTALELHLERQPDPGDALSQAIRAKLAGARQVLAEAIEPDRLCTGRYLWLRRDGAAPEGPFRLLHPIPAHCPEPAIDLLSATGIALVGLRRGDRTRFEHGDGRVWTIELVHVASDPSGAGLPADEHTPSSQSPRSSAGSTGSGQGLGPERPTILIERQQGQRLAQLADQALDHAPDIAGRLLDELERAQWVEDGQLPTDVVAIGREVDYLDEASGQQRSIRLVWPAQADLDRGRISILTAVGTGLIGVRSGAAIDWRVQDGSTRRLRILAVRVAED